MVLLAPAKRHHIGILAQRSSAVSLLEVRPDGRPPVRVGAPSEQEAREACFVLLTLAAGDPEIALRDDVEKSAE